MSGIGIGNEATRTRNRGLVEYIVVSVVILIALVCPAAVFGGNAEPVLAWALTFVPGLVVVCQASRFGKPQQALPFLLFSTMVRVVASLGGGLLAVSSIPALNRDSFLLWIAGLYAVALTAEIYFILAINSLSAVRSVRIETSPSALQPKGAR